MMVTDDHQLENAASALAGAFIIKSLWFKIKCNLFNTSIYKTKWPGRLEMINYKNKIIIFDGSHNISGSEKLNIFLKQKKIKPIVLFGMLNNKNHIETKIFIALKFSPFSFEIPRIGCSRPINSGFAIVQRPKTNDSNPPKYPKAYP